MIRPARLPGALLLTVSLTVACSESSSMPTSPAASSGSSSALTASQIAGTWTLVSMQVDGQAAQAAPGGYSLTLGEGLLSARVDCNTCAGSFTLTGQVLTIGPALACTRAACATMAFESAYTTVLGGQSTVTLSGNALVLSSSRGVLRFTRQLQALAVREATRRGRIGPINGIGDLPASSPERGVRP